MSKTENPIDILNLLAQPAFSVKNGIIQSVNPEAAKCGIEANTAVESLLLTGREEYADYNGGSLYLQLNICGISRGVCINRMQEQDIFILEDEAKDPSLQALALAAKELRTPLSGVLTTVDRLFPKLTSDADPDLIKQMAMINQGLFQILRMVGNMSDAASYSADTQASKEILDICSVIQEVCEQACALGEEAGVQILLKNLSEVVYCPVDREMLERAIYNLLSNAIRFSTEGSCIQISVSKHENRLYLSVQDAGSGIPADLLGTVYTRFLRTPGIEDNRYGIGLGMHLIRSTAAAHGGTVLIQQSREQGVRVTMSFSLHSDPGTALRSPVVKIDYAGERHHGLIELSDVLPLTSFYPDQIN